MIISVNGSLVNDKNLDNDWNNKLGKKQFIGPPSQGCGEKEYSKHILETLKPELHQLPASSQSVSQSTMQPSPQTYRSALTQPPLKPNHDGADVNTQSFWLLSTNYNPIDPNCGILVWNRTGNPTILTLCKGMINVFLFKQEDNWFFFLY